MHAYSGVAYRADFALCRWFNDDVVVFEKAIRFKEEEIARFIKASTEAGWDSTVLTELKEKIDLVVTDYNTKTNNDTEYAIVTVMNEINDLIEENGAFYKMYGEDDIFFNILQNLIKLDIPLLSAIIRLVKLLFSAELNLLTLLKLTFNIG